MHAMHRAVFSPCALPIRYAPRRCLAAHLLVAALHCIACCKFVGVLNIHEVLCLYGFKSNGLAAGRISAPVHGRPSSACNSTVSSPMAARCFTKGVLCSASVLLADTQLFLPNSALGVRLPTSHAYTHFCVMRIAGLAAYCCYCCCDSDVGAERWDGFMHSI